MSAYKAQLLAAIEVMNTIVEIVQSTGNNGCPSGHIYAALMGTMSIDTYERMINLLVEAGKIKRGPMHLLYAI